VDKRALKILLDAFWSPGGWKPEELRGPSPEDFAYAKSKGMMFEPVKLNHQQALKELSVTIGRLDRRCVAAAFLASLSTRRLDWRSPLGSYAVFQHMPFHAPVLSGARCSICGFYPSQAVADLNILNFERCKWGGVRHVHPGYALFDLKIFLDNKVPKPTPDDLRIFRNIVVAITAVPPDVTSASLQSHFAKVIKSNKGERDVIIAILGFCGILETPEHPGFADSFIAVSERRLPDRRFVDMPYPACWWQGSVGVNQAKLNEYFGHAF
jgi:hypothetical protein